MHSSENNLNSPQQAGCKVAEAAALAKHDILSLVSVFSSRWHYVSDDDEGCKC